MAKGLNSVLLDRVNFAALAVIAMGSASTATAQPAPAPKMLAPSEIVAAAPAADWTDIAASDLLVMDLASGKRVVIQLMPPPFSQGWVGNIRKLATARWWDGTAILRVQDNYVVQWGDPSGEDKAKAKPLPGRLVKVPQSDYATPVRYYPNCRIEGGVRSDCLKPEFSLPLDALRYGPQTDPWIVEGAGTLQMRGASGFSTGWPVGYLPDQSAMGDKSGPAPTSLLVAHTWPIHCYGMVGVGRDMPPDTGTGAELYTVIGHAPRHLDRNIALVGRVIAGIENLSSLPRGTGPLGFYEKPEERVTITSVRLGNEVAGLPRYQYLSTESQSFAKYADARANRRDAFFIQPAGGADICNIPVPVRVAKPSE